MGPEPKHEAEIAVLLQPLHLIWSIRADQLKIIAHHFREVMTLNTSGFLVDRHELQKWATEMIAGDGPALLAARGGGSEHFNEQKREEKAKWIEATSMTESEACLFWSFVCYGIAKYKKNNAAWEIWYDNDGHYILYPRLYFDHSLSNGHYGSDSDPHGMWKHICTGDHSQRGVAIVIDLSPLSGG